MANKILNKIFRLAKMTLAALVWYPRDYFRYKKLQKTELESPFYFFPRIFDKDPSSHTFDKHYVYMDRWAFKKILEQRPAEHVDIGSSIRFLSMATTVTKVRFVDIRPVSLNFDNFECIKGSILQMPFGDNSVKSLSCLHVAEHIGLGRYGDELDPQGTIKACRELARILALGGKLYFALPIGKTSVYFNAHRVHDPELILSYFSGLRLLNFSVVNDSGHYFEDANPEDYKAATYACGMYEFTK